MVFINSRESDTNTTAKVTFQSGSWTGPGCIETESRKRLSEAEMKSIPRLRQSKSESKSPTMHETHEMWNMWTIGTPKIDLKDPHSWNTPQINKWKLIFYFIHFKFIPLHQQVQMNSRRDRDLQKVLLRLRPISSSTKLFQSNNPSCIHVHTSFYQNPKQTLTYFNIKPSAGRQTIYDCVRLPYVQFITLFHFQKLCP